MPTIILDRDGVINHDSDQYIKSPSEWVAIDGTPEAIARLNRAGYRVAVATNQSGLARGLFSLETLTDIHRKMTDAIEGAGGTHRYDRVLSTSPRGQLRMPETKTRTSACNQPRDPR